MKISVIEDLMNVIKKDILRKRHSELIEACEFLEIELYNNRIKILENLLKRMERYSFDNFQYLFIMACGTNSFLLVKYLLKNYSIDPSFLNQQALIHAVKYETSNGLDSCFNIIEFLLKDKRVDPSIFNNSLFYKIYLKNKKSNILLLFWNDKRVKEKIKKTHIHIYNEFKKRDTRNKILEF